MLAWKGQLCQVSLVQDQSLVGTEAWAWHQVNLLEHMLKRGNQSYIVIGGS